MSRHLARIGVLAAAGAVLNVLVAWGCALLATFPNDEVAELYAPLGDGLQWEVFRWNTTGGTRALSILWMGGPPQAYNEGDPARLLPWWGGLGRPSRDLPVLGSTVEETWGLPAGSMAIRQQSRRVDGRMHSSSSGAWKLRSRAPGVRPLALPLRPLVVSFAINTLLYGLVISTVLSVARDLRHVLRRRAGRRAAAAAPAEA